jgi:glycosyltransferase involved in cell wall biosynthesis
MKIVSVNVHYQDKLGYQDYFLGKEWKNMGHDVHFVSSDVHFDYPDYDNTVKHIIGDKYVGTGTFINDYGVPVHRLKGTKKKYTGLIWLKGFKKKLIELKPDVIISHGIFNYQSIRLLFFARSLNCPVIFDDHTTINLIRKSLSSKIVFSVFRTFFASRFMKVAHKLIGISATCIDVMRDYFGLTGAKVQMIPLGSDTTNFFKSENLRSRYRDELGVDSETVVISYTGKMYEEKKVHLIIDALNDLEVAGENKILIHLVGDASKTYLPLLQEKIKTSKHIVNYKKAVSIEELPAIYNASDIAVWPDHLTNSTIDASACGCPIICSHYMPERVAYNNGLMVKAGSLVELKAALKKMIGNEELRNDMGANGIRLVQNELSWNAVAKKFIS